MNELKEVIAIRDQTTGVLETSLSFGSVTVLPIPGFFCIKVIPILNYMLP